MWLVAGVDRFGLALGRAVSGWGGIAAAVGPQPDAVEAAPAGGGGGGVGRDGSGCWSAASSRCGSHRGGGEAMSSARRVPETRLLGGGELSADHAWRALRRYGGWQLLRDALVRFRFGDGFSHARAL